MKHRRIRGFLAGMNLNGSRYVPGHAWFNVDGVYVCLPVEDDCRPIPGVYDDPRAPSDWVTESDEDPRRFQRRGLI